MTAVLVVIGNSDDRLVQTRWAEFIQDVDACVGDLATRTGVILHGRWHAYPGTSKQSASWLLQVDPLVESRLVDLRDDLYILCRRYEQDSIAWVTGEIEFIGPERESQ